MRQASLIQVFICFSRYTYSTVLNLSCETHRRQIIINGHNKWHYVGLSLWELDPAYFIFQQNHPAFDDDDNVNDDAEQRTFSTPYQTVICNKSIVSIVKVRVQVMTNRKQATDSNGAPLMIG